MTDDEIRERAFGFVRKNADNWSADDIDNLASLLASERAAAMGAAAEVCLAMAEADGDRERSLPRGLDRAIVEGRNGAACDLAGRILSLSPDGWTAVRTEDLVGLVDAARGAVSAAELIDRDRATDAGFLLALRMADALRAALARMP